MQKNLTSGSVWRTVTAFALPYLLSYFLQTLYGMADLFIIGQFDGVASTTAVSVGSQVMHMLTVMLVGLAMGTTVLVGRAVGGNRPDQAAHCIGNTITLFAGVALALTAVLVALVRPIVQLIATPAEAVEGTVAYLTICFLGIPFITAYNIISAIYRGLGDSKSPMYFIAIACAANVGLDYLFIGGLGMGPAGAALGTTLSQSLSVAVALWAMRRRGSLRLARADLAPNRRTMAELLRIGVPVALQDGFIQVSFMLITVIVNQRGLTQAAAVGIVEKMISLLFLVPSSMLSTVSALGAQNIGAGKPARARQVLRYACAIAVCWGLACVVFMQLFSGPVIGLFTASDEVVRFGVQYMRGYVWDCVLAGIHFSFSGYFCACGHAGLSFMHNMAAILAARIPLALLATRYFPHTLLPMGLATATGSGLSAAICLAAYLWLRRREQAAAAHPAHSHAHS